MGCLVMILIFKANACGSRKFFSEGGPTLTTFLVDECREDPNSTISGPSSTRQRNAI